MALTFVLFLGMSFALFSVGIAGIMASKHAVIIVFSSEVGLMASMLLSVSLFYFGTGGNLLGLLFAIWAIAAAEAMALIVIYRYLGKAEMSLDVRKLSKFRG